MAGPEVGVAVVEAPVAAAQGTLGGLEAGAGSVGTIGGGGLGGGIGNVERLGIAPPSLEIPHGIERAGAGIDEIKISPEAALAGGLEATLGTPDIGIQRAAGVEVSDIVPPPIGALDKSPLDTSGGTEALVRASESVIPPAAEVSSNGRVPAKTEEQVNGTRGGTAREAAGPDTTPSDKNPPTETQDKSASTDKQGAKPPEDADKAKRTQELAGRVKDKKATTDEIKELRGLKQDPEQHRKDLEQKALGGTITDEEAQELGDMNIPKDAKELTPQEQTEKLKKEMEDLGTDIVMKFANGEEVSPEELKRFQELRLQASNIENGLTPDQARQTVREVLARGYGQESGKVKDIQQKLRELMAMELQMQTIPHTVEALRQQREVAKQEARAKHDEAESASGQSRLNKKQEEYTAYMKVAGIKAQITAVKDMVPRMNARRMQLEQDVRSGLGITGPLRSIVEHAGAIGYSAYTEATITIGNTIDED